MGNRFVRWLGRGGADEIVLSLAAGFFVEWFFDKGEGFNPVLFVLGILAVWGLASLTARIPRKDRREWWRD